jgi:hypothetical protein
MSQPVARFSSPYPTAPWRRVIRTILAVTVLFSAASLSATTVKAPEFTDLVNQSDYIVRAVVKSVSSDFVASGSRNIVSFVELEVQEVIAGRPPQPLILRVMGGKVGDREMVLEGAPQFTVGDEGIYFVRGNGRQVYPLVAMMHGVYPIKREANGRAFMMRSNHVPLQDAAEVAQPMSEGSAAQLQQRMRASADALTPAQFAQRIRDAVKPSNTRLHER